MTSIDKWFVGTLVGFAISIAAIAFFLNSTPKHTVSVPVLSSQFIKETYHPIAIPAMSRYGGFTSASKRVPPHWEITVEIEGKVRTIDLLEKESTLAQAPVVKVSYRFLKGGQFRAIAISPAD